MTAQRWIKNDKGEYVPRDLGVKPTKKAVVKSTGMEIVGTTTTQIPSGYGYKTVECQVGKCDICGRRVELLTHTNQCRCGQRYNMFGQKVTQSILG